MISKFPKGSDARGNAFWQHLGERVRFRREQVAISSARAAAHLGVPLQLYTEYEAGELLIPAKQLAEIAALFAVPVFYFFEDLRVSNDRSDASELAPAPAYTVATDIERVASLVDDFRKLDFEGQQHALMVVRALAGATRGDHSK